MSLAVVFIPVSRGIINYNKYVTRRITSPKSGVIASLGWKDVDAADDVVLTAAETQFGPQDKSICCAAAV